MRATREIVTGSEVDPDAIGRDSTALAIQRGVGRLMRAQGFACVAEMLLPSGRRADIVGLSGKGDIWIVEIKSSVADFRADQKWPEYLDFADAFFFAVAPDFPVFMLPEDTGLILADRYGGEIVRTALEARLTGARRTALTRRFARCAALRLQTMFDPELVLSPQPYDV